MFTRSLLALFFIGCAPAGLLPTPAELADPLPEKSDGFCGDGVVDVGEACDNQGSESDGCLSDCLAEAEHWWEEEPNDSVQDVFVGLVDHFVAHGSLAPFDTDIIAYQNLGESGALVRVFTLLGDGPDLTCDESTSLGFSVSGGELAEPLVFAPGSSVGGCAFGQLVVHPREVIYVSVSSATAIPAYRILFAPY